MSDLISSTPPGESPPLTKGEKIRALWNDPAWREKAIAASRRACETPEVRQKMAEKRRAWAATPEGKAQILAMAKKANEPERWTAERRAKLSANRKGKGTKNVAPEVKAARAREHTRRHRLKPGVVEKQRKYAAQYNQLPHIKKKNRETMAAYRKTKKFQEWRERTKDVRRERARQDAAKRRASVSGTLKNRVSRAINSSLRDGKNRISVWKAVGYTSDDLKRHLERQFTKGMTWEVFQTGAIHIDHIIPVSHFCFSAVEDSDLKHCWALSNLRPMWADKNMLKGATREHLL